VWASPCSSIYKKSLIDPHLGLTHNACSIQEIETQDVDRDRDISMLEADDGDN
jgi:hypothetical protein